MPDRHYVKRALRLGVCGPVGTGKTSLIAVLCYQASGPLDRAVMQRHDVAMPGQVSGQIPAHDGEPGDAYVGDSGVRLPGHRVAPLGVLTVTIKEIV